MYARLALTVIVVLLVSNIPGNAAVITATIVAAIMLTYTIGARIRTERVNATFAAAIRQRVEITIDGGTGYFYTTGKYRRRVRLDWKREEFLVFHDNERLVTPGLVQQYNNVMAKGDKPLESSG